MRNNPFSTIILTPTESQPISSNACSTSSLVNVFEGENENFGIYGFTNLNRVMEQISEGTSLKITYKGTKNLKTKYGLKDVHQVSVERWEDEETKLDEPPPFPGDEDVPPSTKEKLPF